MAHAGFQVSELPPARGPLRARQLLQKSAAGAERWEREDGRPSRGDGRGRMSAQRWLSAPAAGTKPLCQTGSSHGARFHTILHNGSVGLLIPARGAGRSLRALSLLRVCPRPAESSLRWRASSPLPARRGCCQPRPCARQRSPLRGHQRVSMCVMCQSVCAVCLFTWERGSGGRGKG